MLRIIDGHVYEGKPSEDRWFATVYHLGNGQREACIQRAIDWEDAGPLNPDSIAAQVLRGEREDPDKADKERANRFRAARRAKSKVRRLCKAFGLDHMLTLTYRENQTDLGRCKRDVKEFVRRVKRLIPGFRYVAAYEPQERGAWHSHIALRAIEKRFRVSGCWVKSFDALRSIWRGVVGIDNGNIDMSDGRGRGKNRRPRKRSPARLAAYMSKYMLKGWEDGDLWDNRYSSSLQGDLPQGVRMQFHGTTLAELLPLVFDEAAGGDCEVFTWLSRFGDVFYVSSEPPGEPEPLQPWEG